MNNGSPAHGGPGSPSKEPLMSPARGVGRGGAVPRAEQPSPVHARTNVSYKCLTPSSTPGSSPLHTSRGSSGRGGEDGPEHRALLEGDEGDAVDSGHLSASSIPRSGGGGRENGNGRKYLNAHFSDTKNQSNNDKITIEQLSSADLNNKLVDKVAWQNMCSSQYKSPSTSEPKPNEIAQKQSSSIAASFIKKTRSDTILSLFTRKSASNVDRQSKSTSAIPAHGGPPVYGSRTGTVRRQVWSGEQMRADMVDLSELYANPNTMLSFGVLAVTVGCVSLALSFSSKGMKLWFNVGCVALGVGIVTLSLGSAWYYVTSRLIYAQVKHDVEIKVVSGTEGGGGGGSASPNPASTTPNNSRHQDDRTGV